MNARDDHSATAALADLDVLRRAEPAKLRAPRALLPRLLVLLLVLGGIAALYGAFVDPLLFPPREVRLAPVREIAGAAAATRAAVATAAGWLEAEPYPVTVRPLVYGVVERFEVLEGQVVKRGETVIAVLRNQEHESALAAAEAEQAAKAARVASADARLARAQALLGQKLELRSAVLAADLAAREASAGLAEAKAELAHSEAEVEQAAAELEAQRVLQGTGGTAPLALRVAEATYAAQRAHRDVAAAVVVRAEAQADVREKELALAQEALADPRGLSTEVTVATQEAAEARSEEHAAGVQVALARTRVNLLRVVASADGVVQRLLASVGAPAGPDAFMAREVTNVGPGSTGGLDATAGGLALLYDPARLQARVEVPVSELGAIDAQGEVALEVDAVRGRAFRGQVLRLGGEANIQNNKLWVKVRLLESDPLLRPEMLVRARFLSKQPAAGEAPAGRPRLEVPSTALHGDSVFVFDPTRGGRARRVHVVKKGEASGFTEVEGALGLSTEVILAPQGLEDGMKVRPLR